VFCFPKSRINENGGKATFGGPEQDPKILQSIERGNVTFVYLCPESELRLRSFSMIRIRISDPRSLGSWCIKGTDESMTMQIGFVGSFDAP